MKTFSTSGTGNQQTLSEIESDKMPIYNSVADVEADLANLEEGQIVSTKDTGTELSAPVDVVEEGNLHAVTSNAVADSLDKLVLTETIQTSISVSANAWKEDSLTIPSKSGYTVINVFLYVTSGGAYVEIGTLSGSVFLYRIYNTANSTETYNIKAIATYLKN